MSKAIPTEPGILAFHKRCQDFYPEDAVDASIGQQRAWYDALCAEFDAPSPDGLTRQDETVGGRIPVRRYRPAEIATQSGSSTFTAAVSSSDRWRAMMPSAPKLRMRQRPIWYRSTTGLRRSMSGPRHSTIVLKCCCGYLPMGGLWWSSEIAPVATLQRVWR